MPATRAHTTCTTVAPVPNRVVAGHAIQLTGEVARRNDSQRDADSQADTNLMERPDQNHADADLSGAASHVVGRDAIQPNRGQQ